MGTEALYLQPALKTASYAQKENSFLNMGTLRKFNALPIYMKNVMNETKGAISVQPTNDITNWSFLGGTFLEKWVDKCSPEIKGTIKSLDKSLIDSSVTQKAIENLFDCKFQTGEAGKLFLSASKDTLKTETGKLVANTLGTTTRFGLLASTLTEIPDLYSAYKNGDFGKQTIRSTANIATSSIAFGLVAHLAKEYAPPKIKTLCMIAGAIAGSTLAHKATTEIMDKFLGDSIKTQKQKTMKKLAELKQQRTQFS